VAILASDKRAIGNCRSVGERRRGIRNGQMEKRELGNTGLKVSVVGFGASPLGHVFGDVPLSVAIASVRRALDLGINFFDTSPSVHAQL
jgi:hypothetical protein